MGIFVTDGEITEEGERFWANYDSVVDKTIKVGFNEKSGYEPGDGDEDKTTTAMAAFLNEIGTEQIPSRPFMRNTLRNNEQEIKAFMSAKIQLMLKGSINSQTALNLIGNYVKGLMQNEIESGTFEPNAEVTIKRKKSDHPLIDTGHMRQSIVYEIEDGKG